MSIRRWLAGWLSGWLLLGAAQADTGSRQVELAANGRFDELEVLLEPLARQGSVRTRDLHALCFAHSKTKRYDRLMPCLDRLEEGVRKGDKRTRLLGLEDATPSIHVMRADALIELAQYPGAVAEAGRCLDWLRKEDSDDLDMTIQCLSAMSLASTLGGDPESGRKHALELQAVKTGFFNTDYDSVKALALGRVWMALGEYGLAVKAIESDRTFKFRSFLDNLVSGAFLRGVNNWVWAELPRYFMVTKAYFESGRIDDARKGYDELLNIPQVQANGEIHWQLLSDRARIAERDGQLPQAAGLYRKAVDVIEQQRLTIATEANKIGFVGDKQQVYGRLVDTLFRSDRPEETFEFIERAKARALVDLLAQKEAVEAPVLKARRAGDLLTKVQQASRTSLTQVPVDMARGGVSVRSAAASQDLPSLVGALRSAEPELASLVSVTAVPVEEIQQRLFPDEVLLQFYAFGGRLFAVAVWADGLDIKAIQADGLEKSVREFRTGIEEGSEQSVERGRVLYDRLLRPFQDRIQGKGLLIVPHGPLHYLPFAALHDGTQHVIHQHVLRYLPSASVMRFLRPPRGQGLEGMLVLGNPDLGDRRFDLPSAEVEARVVSKLSQASEVFLRKDATEEVFKRRAAEHRVLHIASHGEFNASDALKSRLLLGKSGSDDGSLTVAELYELQLDADLVTLSACETGLGRVLSGDDVLGLTRGFLYAGSRNVVASQWQVDDAATAELMQRFYGHLKAGMPMRQALRQAQIETSKAYPHPFFWAAFFLTGHGA